MLLHIKRHEDHTYKQNTRDMSRNINSDSHLTVSKMSQPIHATNNDNQQNNTNINRYIAIGTVMWLPQTKIEKQKQIIPQWINVTNINTKNENCDSQLTFWWVSGVKLSTTRSSNDVKWHKTQEIWNHLHLESGVLFFSWEHFRQHFAFIMLASVFKHPVFPCGPHNAINVEKPKIAYTMDTAIMLITNIPNWYINWIWPNSINEAAPNVVTAPDITDSPILSSIVLTRSNLDVNGEDRYASAKWTT